MSRVLGARKRGIFLAVLVLVMAGTLEAASFVALCIRDGRLERPASWRAQRETAARESGEPLVGRSDAGIDAGGMQVIHPYLGYVLNPDFKDITWRDVNAQGFQVRRGDVPPPPTTPRFVVAVLGGSVAGALCLRGREPLLDEIGRSPGAQGKTVVVQCFAMGGYKQPQQLMALAYALSLGEAIDVAINIDGFNEVALPIAENLASGVYPFYPRGWSARVEGAPSIDALRTVGRIVSSQDERLRWTGLCATRPLLWSPTCHLVWSTLDRRLARRVFESQATLASTRGRSSKTFVASGPVFGALPRAQLCRLLAEHWSRSSTLMFDLSRARGIRYVHVLQPNQYLTGSKPMGRSERLTAFDPGHPYRSPVDDCYPALIEAGKQLVHHGVPFHDLTGLFAGHAEPLYDDACCHYNQEGYRLLARAIGHKVVEAMARPAPQLVRE